MSERYNGNTKRPKPKEIQLRNLKNKIILPENSAEGLGSRGERDRERQRETEADRAAEVIFMRIHPKS